MMIAMGDYYVWFCDWCDSRNHTLWTKIEKDQVVCGACHNIYSITATAQQEEISAIA